MVTKIIDTDTHQELLTRRNDDFGKYLNAGDKIRCGSGRYWRVQYKQYELFDGSWAVYVK